MSFEQDGYFDNWIRLYTCMKSRYNIDSCKICVKAVKGWMIQ